VGTASTLIMDVMVLARYSIVSPTARRPPATRAGSADLVQAYADMSVSRGIEDIERSLVRHSHDHPPVRDLNRESDRRRSGPRRAAAALVRAVGSWAFLAIQVVVSTAWVVMNAVALTTRWDPPPFPLLDLVFGFEVVLALVATLMAMNLAADRERLRAQGDFEMHVKLEEELRTVMTHLEVQDEVMLEIIQRLDHSDRELRRLTRRLGVEERI
jgi:uncharacterized membrane protein